MKTISFGQLSGNVAPGLGAKAAGPNPTVLAPNAVHFGHEQPASESKDRFEGVQNPADQPRRTRAQNLKDLFVDYLKRGLLGNVLFGSLIGGLIALGSPVMAVTVPTSIAAVVGLNVLFRAAVGAFADPNGPFMAQLFRASRMPWLDASQSQPPKAPQKEPKAGPVE